MPVKGASAVRKKMRRVFKDINQKKAVQFVNAVISIGASQSKQWAPVEFSNLINSQISNVTQTADLVTGTLSYNTSYAAALEFGKKWKPRPPSEKAGPAWNPNATPGYLRRGFEDPESRSLIKQAEKIFKV